MQFSLQNKKILIIQQKMIGDVLTSSIYFEIIKKNSPSTQLHYLINDHTLPVIENNPYIDKTIIITKEIEKNKIKFFNFVNQIKKEKYDVVIDAYCKIGSSIISFFSGASLTISYKKNNSFFYTHPIERLKEPKKGYTKAIENRLLLLTPLNLQNHYTLPKIYLTSQEIEKGKKFLKDKLDFNKPIFMISVLGSDHKKTYPYEYMAKVLDNIIDFNKNIQILFNYIPKQITEVKMVYNLCKPITQQKIFLEIYGNSLRDFLSITYHCNAIIGNEGGAINMAKAINIPSFTIFSPYIKKSNWYSEENPEHNQAVHLSDFKNLTKGEITLSKKNPESSYRLLKPELFKDSLNDFLKLNS